jgi:uncharacterized protein
MHTLASINLIAQRLAAVASSPAKVILFGSYARGEANEDSDVDLLVLQNDFSNRAQEYLRLAREAHLMAPNVEVILMKNEDYEWKSLVGGTLPYWASREGLVLHDPA